VSKKNIDVLVISLTSPLLVGIYHEDELIKTYSSQEKTSDILPIFFEKILKQYQCQNLYFANGPGSFMAIKITYLFLKTLSISLNVPLFATNGFSFNEKSPIKAVGALYFIEENGTIRTQKIDVKNTNLIPFSLPKHLDKQIFSDQTKPLYILPAV